MRIKEPNYKRTEISKYVEYVQDIKQDRQDKYLFNRDDAKDVKIYNSTGKLLQEGYTCNDMAPYPQDSQEENFVSILVQQE